MLSRQSKPSLQHPEAGLADAAPKVRRLSARKRSATPKMVPSPVSPTTQVAGLRRSLVDATPKARRALAGMQRGTSASLTTQVANPRRSPSGPGSRARRRSPRRLRKTPSRFRSRRSGSRSSTDRRRYFLVRSLLPRAVHPAPRAQVSNCSW